MSDLAPTAGVVLAKTLDSLVMPMMSMLVYVVPNFQALDVSNTRGRRLRGELEP